jgi:hypothetical protein
MNSEEMKILEEKISSRIDSLIKAALEGIKDIHVNPSFLQKIGKPLSSNEGLLCLMGVHSSFINYLIDKIKSNDQLFNSLETNLKDEIIIDSASFKRFKELKSKFLTDLAVLEKINPLNSQTSYPSYCAFKEFNLEKVVSQMNTKVMVSPLSPASMSTIEKTSERLTFAFNKFSDFFSGDFKGIDFKPNFLEKTYVCGNVLAHLISAYMSEVEKSVGKYQQINFENYKSYINSVDEINQKIFNMNVFFLVSENDMNNDH